MLNIAIIGSGNIGLDLLMKCLKTEKLNVVLITGREINSKGLEKARELGVDTYVNSIEAVKENAQKIDLVFDATSAAAHRKHAPILKELGIISIDMTPSNIGYQVVPTINLDEVHSHENINMISCGGQASIPIINVISELSGGIDYVEVVSTIASKSAGIATRNNISEYIETTQKAIRDFCKVKKSKTILIVNPAEPCVDMQVSIRATLKDYDEKRFVDEYNALIDDLKVYIPGYKVVVAPHCIDGEFFTMVSVNTNGDYLPKYAGNLEIINDAAIYVACEIAKGRESV